RAAPINALRLSTRGSGRHGGRTGPNASGRRLRADPEGVNVLMNPTDIKFTVAANLKGDVPGLVQQSTDVITAIQTHPPLFPNSGPIVQDLKDSTKALTDKLAVTGQLKRSARARTKEENTLRSKMLVAARFTEDCANADPANGPAIIAASTFSEKV